VEDEVTTVERPSDVLLQVYVARRPKVFTQETLTFTDVELCVEGYEREVVVVIGGDSCGG
jgi:hypothetical protein